MGDTPFLHKPVLHVAHRLLGGRLGKGRNLIKTALIRSVREEIRLLGLHGLNKVQRQLFRVLQERLFLGNERFVKHPRRCVGRGSSSQSGNSSINGTAKNSTRTKAECCTSSQSACVKLGGLSCADLDRLTGSVRDTSLECAFCTSDDTGTDHGFDALLGSNLSSS